MSEVSLPDLEPTIDDFLKIASTRGASDLHLSCGKKPKMRIDGSLKDMDGPFILSPQWMEREMRGIMTNVQEDEYRSRKELDFSYAVEGFSRFRVNFYVQSSTPAAVFRTIPEKILTLEELHLPQSLADITNQPNGLVLVTGPTGSGKSTTLAAMIEERNRNYEEHILTIEDPVEFIYESKKALINQREVGADTLNFDEALKRVLRQDPDVILIGELRDPTTIAIALSAAETGHLVFGTLHTQSAAKSINRIIDSFGPDKQAQIRSQLADTLRAIISQTLLPKKNGGRIAATEILVKNTAIANNIREGKTSAIRDYIQSGKQYGMHTLDQDLVRLVKDNTLDRELAAEFMEDPKQLPSHY